MKKILMALILNLGILQSYANVLEEEKNSETNSSTLLEAHENIVKKGALVAGTTLFIWGTWGMRNHIGRVYDMYEWICKTVNNYTENHPNVRAVAEYTLPVAAVVGGYSLIKYLPSPF